MEIILRKNIKGLGNKNDTVKVKPGYGRNFLIPKGIAIIANKSNKKMIDENIRQATYKTVKLKQDAQAIADKMNGIVLDIIAKAGESGKIFGTITALQISNALAVKGFKIDRKKINFNQIKNLGTYKILIDLHKKVQQEISLNIITE